MSRIIITEKHLAKHKIHSGIVHLEFRTGIRWRLSLISALGFSMKRKKNSVKLNNLQPTVGFHMDPTKLEFREKLREGLMVTYHIMDGGVQIIIENIYGNGEVIPLYKEK